MVATHVIPAPPPTPDAKAGPVPPVFEIVMKSLVFELLNRYVFPAITLTLEYSLAYPEVVIFWKNN